MSRKRQYWCEKHRAVKVRLGPYTDARGNQVHHWYCRQCNAEYHPRKQRRKRKGFELSGFGDGLSQELLARELVKAIENAPVVQFEPPKLPLEGQLAWLEDMTELLERRPELARRCHRLADWVLDNGVEDIRAEAFLAAVGRRG